VIEVRRRWMTTAGSGFGSAHDVDSAVSAGETLGSAVPQDDDGRFRLRDQCGSMIRAVSGSHPRQVSGSSPHLIDDGPARWTWCAHSEQLSDALLDSRFQVDNRSRSPTELVGGAAIW
jgi:hypothetical protein